MRRIISVLAALVFVAPLYAASGTVALNRRTEIAHGPTVKSESSSPLTIPAATLVKARLISGMHTLVSHVNDPVSAQMTEPVYISGRLALPAGTLFDGHITSIRRPKRMRQNGEICFRFDHVTLPDGEELPVSAVITRLENSRGLKGRLDSEGNIEGHRRRSWKTFLGGALGVGGLTAAKIIIASSAALTVAAPASAAGLVGYELFLRRGSNVNVPPMTPCSIRLITSLRIPVLG